MEPGVGRDEIVEGGRRLVASLAVQPLTERATVVATDHRCVEAAVGLLDVVGELLFPGAVCLDRLVEVHGILRRRVVSSEDRPSAALDGQHVASDA